MCGCQLERQTEQIDIPNCEQLIHRDGKINSESDLIAKFS